MFLVLREELTLFFLVEKIPFHTLGLLPKKLMHSNHLIVQKM